MTQQHPFDLHSHLAWLRDKELDAINKANRDHQSWHITLQYQCLASAYREVIDHIEKQPKELHRCMVPVGWDTIDP